jgi:hypothetical protein
LRPTRSEIRAEGTVATTVTTATMTCVTGTQSALSSLVIPNVRVRKIAKKPIRAFTPARNIRREITRFTKLFSRRMSVPQADFPIETQDRPFRSRATRPSRTQRSVPTAVANSTRPRAIVGSVKSPMT